jgi:hypothetical protein
MTLIIRMSERVRSAPQTAFDRFAQKRYRKMRKVKKDETLAQAA